MTDDLPNHAPAAMLPALKLIESADPSGWSDREPNALDYDTHKVWALDRFGAEVWSIYARGGWADDRDEPAHVEY